MEVQGDAITFGKVQGAVGKISYFF